MIMRRNPWQKSSKSTKNKEKSLQMKTVYPWWNFQKECKKRDRADKLGNDDTSAEDQKSVNEISSFNEHTKESCRLRPYCKLS